jgi:hypothetical protein
LGLFPGILGTAGNNDHRLCGHTPRSQLSPVNRFLGWLRADLNEALAILPNQDQTQGRMLAIELGRMIKTTIGAMLAFGNPDVKNPTAHQQNNGNTQEQGDQQPVFPGSRSVHKGSGLIPKTLAGGHEPRTRASDGEQGSCSLTILESRPGLASLPMIAVDRSLLALPFLANVQCRGLVRDTRGETPQQ